MTKCNSMFLYVIRISAIKNMTKSNSKFFCDPGSSISNMTKCNSKFLSDTDRRYKEHD